MKEMTEWSVVSCCTASLKRLAFCGGFQSVKLPHNGKRFVLVRSNKVITLHASIYNCCRDERRSYDSIQLKMHQLRRHLMVKKAKKEVKGSGFKWI